MARRVIVHIGLMKSGTTFIQGRLGANRERLGAQGVLFPGPHWRRHVNAVQDLMRHQARTPGSWESLTQEVNAYDGTAVISMEYLVMARERAIDIIARAFRDAELRIVVGARDLGRTVPAMWQEAVKNRSTLTFAEYLDGIRDGAENGQRFWRQQHAGRIVTRWAKRLGPERVYVVTLPPPDAPGDVLWHRFCEVAGIRDDSSWDEPPRTNESLGVASALVMRRLNERTEDLEVRDYKLRVKAVGKHLLPSHRSAEDPIGFRVPDWLREEAARIRSQISGSGVHVVGDLDDLTPLDVPGVDPGTVDAEAELEAALVALEGAVRQAKRIRPL
ncbi:MAG TPA: hypothetical protein VGK78_04985 [Nocardioides sp.]|uniref:hypothetical protein n=1 Tax=Nocardioides sp. TaxID=35761 RepID=UPI002F407185